MSKLINFASLLLLYVCVSLVSVTSVNGYANNKPLDITNAARANVDGQYVTYLDETQPLNPQVLLQNPAQFQWQPLNKASINLGKKPHPIWIRFDVINNSNEPINRTLELSWVHLSQVDMYVRDTQQQWQHFKSGLMRPTAEYYQNNPSYLFPITLQPGEQKTVYMRVYSTFVYFIPLSIWPKQELIDHQKTEYIFYSLAFGILIAMMLYNASLYVFTRDRVFLVYSYYVGAVIFYELSHTGIANYVIWSDSQWLKLNGYALSIYACFLGVSLFINDFFDLKKFGRWQLYSNRFFSVFCVLGLLDQLLGTFLMRSFAGALILLMCISLMLSSIKNAWLGDINSRYFVVAWGSLVAFTFLNVATIEGYSSNAVVANYGQLIGFVLEMILLSFALAHRINRERKERELAQAQALRLQKTMVREREQKIRAQEELLTLQQQSNSALEEKVKERTQVLELTMQNLQNANIELSKLSVTDPLTQVYNRRYFDEVFNAESQRASRNLRPLALILVDVDHFKQFNDNYGHLAGDDCLRMVAKALEIAAARKNDLVARFGGEEFAIVMPETSEQEAFLVAEKLRKAVANLDFICKGKKVAISASFGIAAMADSHITPSGLIAAADKALYQAKHEGRNRAVRAHLAAG